MKFSGGLTTVQVKLVSNKMRQLEFKTKLKCQNVKNEHKLFNILPLCIDKSNDSKYSGM